MAWTAAQQSTAQRMLMERDGTISDNHGYACGGWQLGGQSNRYRPSSCGRPSSQPSCEIHPPAKSLPRKSLWTVTSSPLPRGFVLRKLSDAGPIPVGHSAKTLPTSSHFRQPFRPLLVVSDVDNLLPRGAVRDGWLDNC